MIAYLGTEDDRKKMIKRFEDYDLANGCLVFKIDKVSKKRSDAQNRLYWLWLDLIRQHIYVTTSKIFSQQDIHEWFKDEFLPKQPIVISGKTKHVAPSTTRLKVKDMHDYLEQIDIYCASKLDFILPTPDELCVEGTGYRDAS